MAERRELTPEEVSWANNLKAIWLEKKKEEKLTQEQLADLTGYKTQSAITQYVNGKIPLGYQAKLRFSKALKVPVTQIDPNFPVVDKSGPNEDEEADFVYRGFLELDEPSRQMILVNMRTLLDKQSKD